MTIELPEDTPDSAPLEPSDITPGDSLPDVPGEPMPESSESNPGEISEATGEPTLGDDAADEMPLDASVSPVAASDTTSFTEGGADASSEPSNPQVTAPQTDWSKFEPAPGKDKATGKPIFRYGRVDQAGFEVMKLVYGLTPLFEPELNDSGDETPPPPFFKSFGDDDGSPFGAADFAASQFPAAGVSAPIFVDVRVSLSEGAIEQVSKSALRKAAEFSRAETLVVARKVHELHGELRDHELQHRIVWGRY